MGQKRTQMESKTNLGSDHEVEFDPAFLPCCGCVSHLGFPRYRMDTTDLLSQTVPHSLQTNVLTKGGI